MPWPEANNLFYLSSNVVRLDREVKKVFLMLDKVPVCVGGISVGSSLVLRAKWKAEKVPPQVFQEIGHVAFEFVRLPGCQSVGTEEGLSGGEGHRPKHASGSGDRKGHGVRCQFVRGCPVY